MSNGSEEDVIQALIAQCKSNDVDHKIRALVNLQYEIEKSSAVLSADSLVNTLKACLRTSNSQLYIPALTTIHAFLKLVERCTPRPDTLTTRQLVTAFLPTGGVIDRLGETREPPRENSRQIVVLIGSLCYNSAGGIQPPTTRSRDAQKGNETPLVQFERLLREVGFASKIWRVREQSIQSLLQIRRTIPTFPLRPFLPPLVQALQDPDGTVRDCARKSVIAIFSGAGITDAAKADLKREMDRQSIRKGLSEEILAGVIGAQAADIPEARIPLPPSRHPTMFKSSTERGETPEPEPAVAQPRGDGEVPAVFIASARDLEQELSRMLPHFQGKETEHNWQERERSIMRLRGMVKGEIHRRYEDVFFIGLKQGIMEATFKPLASLRTTLASQTCLLYSDLAEAYKTALDPFVESLLINLLRLAGYTKKIIASQSQSVVSCIIRNTSPQIRIVIPLICGLLQEKFAPSRSYAAEHIKTFITTHAPKSRSSIESTGGLETLEKAIHKALTDPSPSVREPARLCFWSFYSVWPERASLIMEKLDLTARKQLQKVSPTPEAYLNGLPVTPEPKKSSVAAAIAASRAKAKQIAAAPPTLRHQATSTSHFSHTNPQGPSISRTTSGISTKTSPRSVRTVTSEVKVAIPVKKGRTPSTTTLPASSDGSARGTPSPPLSVGSGEFHPKLSPNARSSKSSKGSRLTPSSSAAMTPSKIRDAASRAVKTSTNRGRPTSPPFSVSSGNDDRLEESFSLISFSSPPAKLGNRPLSSSLSEPEPAIEEELRARSAQAEAAAEQLLDLTHSNGSLTRPQIQEIQRNGDVFPTAAAMHTPPRRVSDRNFIWNQAKAFEDSPILNRVSGSAPVETKPRSQSNWWLKVKTLLEKNGTSATSACQISDIPRLIESMDQDLITKEELFGIFWFCRNNSTLPGTDLPENPIYSALDTVLHAILGYIIRAKAGNLHAGLLILWEIGEHWAALLNGNELEAYQALFAVRKAEDAMALEATNALRDSMGTSTDPVYGLTTLHACLNESLKRAPSAAIGTCVFGLNGINKFVLRLPAQVLEEELPRIRPLLLKSLSHENSLVRSAASMVVVSAQMVLHDQAHLFALLDGLSEEKKNFLTYLFDKNKIQPANGSHTIMNDTHPAYQKMEQELSRLDGRVNPR